MKKILIYFLFFIITILIVSIVYYLNIKENMQKCIYISNTDNNLNNDKSSNNTHIIERYNIKMTLNDNDKKNLLNQKNFLIPTMVNGTYCDTNYSTYYFIPEELYHNYKYKNLLIRIRNYYFSPGLFFEIKGRHIKIRTEITNNYEIISSSPEIEEYMDLINEMLKKLKTNDLKILSTTKYKRYSFVYYYDKNIRITLDTEIEHNNNKFSDFNIIEIKYPVDYNNNQVITEIQNRLQEINIVQNSNNKIHKYKLSELFSNK